MHSELRRLPHRRAHQALGVMLAALAGSLAGPAAGQNQQSVPPAPTQAPAAKHAPAANTKAQAPATPTPPKPSLLHRLFGGNKGTQPDNNPQQGSSAGQKQPVQQHTSQQQASQQQPFWKKIPLLGGHSGSTTQPSHPAASVPAQSAVAAKAQSGSARAGSQPSAPGPKDNRPGLQNPQRLASLGTARPGASSGGTPGPKEYRSGIQNQQHLAMPAPAGPARNSALLPPGTPPRSFPGRPGQPIGAETRMPNGNLVRTAPDGTVTDMHIAQHNMSVHYGLSGSRQVRVDQPDGSRIVLASRGVPYVQKPWNFGASAFDHRTYFDNGRVYHQFYRPYAFGDRTLDIYAPQRFYSQEFYQSVAKSQMWAAPAWTYNTKQEPWFVHYQTFFTPQPSYSSPLSWLTDFVLAMSLFEAYNAHPLPAAFPAPPPAPLLQAAAAPVSSGQPPIVRSATSVGTNTAAAPVTLARTAYAPIVAPPVTTPPAAAQSPIVAPPVTTPPAAAQSPLVAAPTAAPVAQTPGPEIQPRADDESTSLTLWARFVNFIRGLWGATPSSPPVPGGTPAAALVSAEPVAADTAAPITPDVKSLVADEIGRQIEEESREARANAQDHEPKPGTGSVVEELRSPTQHVFVVASDLDLVDDTGRRCMISEGDVIQIISAVNTKTSSASGVVLSSKGGVECAHSATVDIAVDDLQEMQNHMRASIDQGLANTPRGAAEATVTPAFAAAAPLPDPEAKSAIEQQKAIAATADRT